LRAERGDGVPRWDLGWDLGWELGWDFGITAAML
jgi:hypothetical protein